MISVLSGAGRMALLAATFAATLAGMRAGEPIAVNFDKRSGIEIRMTQVYKSLPPYGYMPIRIEIKNDSGYERTWNFRFVNSRRTSFNHEMELSSTRSLTVENKAKRTFNLLVPLAPRSTTNAYGNSLSWQGSGYGLSNDGMEVIVPNASPKNRTPFFLLGNDLGAKLWTQLMGEIKSGSMEVDGSPVEAQELPVDWRGYQGCTLVMLSEREWTGMQKAQQTALLDWVAQGGTFGVLSRSGDLDLAKLTGKPRAFVQNKNRPEMPVGFGKVLSLSGANSMAPSLAQLIRRPNAAIPDVDEALNQYTDNWGLSDRLTGIQANQTLMIIFVIIFAILIGPVNLFFFANRHHRYRLFWTTPLISIGASLLLLLVIFIFDGLGGIGQRMVVSVILPDENRMIACQEEISRTAVLASGAFQPGEDASCQQVIFNADASTTYKPINRLRKDGSMSPIYSAQQAQKNNLAFFQDRGWYSGDYFQSRAVQAQYLTSRQSTRGRIDLLALAGDGTPKVTSSFAQTLEVVFYRDGEGKLWKLDNLNPGARVSLKPAEKKEFDDFWNEQLATAGGDLYPRLRRVRDHKHYFFAQSVKGDADPAVDTLSGIRWQTGPVLYLGYINPLQEEDPTP